MCMYVCDTSESSRKWGRRMKDGSMTADPRKQLFSELERVSPLFSFVYYQHRKMKKTSNWPICEASPCSELGPFLISHTKHRFRFWHLLWAPCVRRLHPLFSVFSQHVGQLLSRLCITIKLFEDLTTTYKCKKRLRHVGTCRITRYNWQFVRTQLESRA